MARRPHNDDGSPNGRAATVRDVAGRAGVAVATVSIPHMELGREAVRLALHRNEAAAPNQHVMLGTHIVPRDSVRPLIIR